MTGATHARELISTTLNYFEIEMPIVVNDELRTIFVFNQKYTGFRNGGMFWEAGAFAIYINIAFFLYLGNLKRIVSKYPWRTIIMVIALITTYSTTGYLLFFLMFLLKFLAFSSAKTLFWQRKMCFCKRKTSKFSACGGLKYRSSKGFGMSIQR